MKQSIAELAKSVGLPHKSTKKIVDRLKRDILISMYRSKPSSGEDDITEFDKKINEKVKEVYKEWYKIDFNPEAQKKNKKLPLFLMGPPGHGKTASYFAAGKEVSAAMGLRFVSNVTDNYKPRETDFIMVVQECAGENSAITFGGIPKAEEIEINGQKVSVLKKAVNYRFTVFGQVAGGILLFDDAANAPSVIQNVLLPVAQNNTFQGLEIKNACVGFTGNLGALDGTYTSEQSSALLTRVLPSFVKDEVDDFCDRAYDLYNDSLGDVGYTHFLRRNAEYFAQLPQTGQKSGFACPRSHDNAIQSIRDVVAKNGGRGYGEEKSLEEIQWIANSCLGPEIGHKLTGYYHSYIKGADPLARSFILSNYASGGHDSMEDNIKTFNQKYQGGTEADLITFGYQFGTACGDYAVSALAQSEDPKKDLEKVMKRYAKAVCLLNDSEFAYAINHMKDKLVSTIPIFAAPSNENEKRQLNDAFSYEIAKHINEDDKCDKSKREILISVITDYDKVKSASLFNDNSGTSVAKKGRVY